MKNEELVIKLGIVFYLCSIFGYVYELILNYYYTNKIFSHGFLKGPWLPIYGSGAVLLLSLEKLKDNPLLLFCLGFILTGTLEYFSGLFLLKIFKMRLWDYTGRLLNINGLVCLLSAFCFGLFSLILIYIIIPLVKKIINKYNKKSLLTIISILNILISLDVYLKFKLN